MSVLSRQSVLRHRPITPIAERSLHEESGMTFGLGPCTLDLRIAQTVWLWPHGFLLASTIEYFTMPIHICGSVMDKSTLARMGVSVQNTFVDPGFKGYLTLEITNHTWRPRKFVAGQPICQVKFEFLDQPTEMPYAGKYQRQGDHPVEPVFQKPEPIPVHAVGDPLKAAMRAVDESEVRIGEGARHRFGKAGIAKLQAIRARQTLDFSGGKLSAGRTSADIYEDEGRN